MSEIFDKKKTPNVDIESKLSLDDIRLEIALEDNRIQENIKKRRETVLQKALQMLSKWGTFKMTKEHEELGLVEELQRAAFEAEMKRRFSDIINREPEDNMNPLDKLNW